MKKPIAREEFAGFVFVAIAIIIPGIPMLCLWLIKLWIDAGGAK